MIPNITGSMEGGDREIRKVSSLSGHMHDEALKSVTMLGSALLLLVKQKLSGPVLKAPTGNMKGATNLRVDESASAITATVGISLGTIPYARIHEYGGTILPKNGPYLVFKTADGAWHKVKSVTMPERSYMRSSLNDLRPTITTELAAVPGRAARAAGLSVK